MVNYSAHSPAGGVDPEKFSRQMSSLWPEGPGRDLQNVVALPIDCTADLLLANASNDAVRLGGEEHQVEHAGCAVPHVRLFLRMQRGIATDEELRWDYGPQYNRTWLAKKARI